ncbi:hypothetical protein QKW35_11890 [Pontibacterium granulatum]|uniref:hypothetical protein n=1 Tax=Pontibacterium granulatum TaxID=2036029 RepID=UPI00249A25D3|nr:hypothetical protein [Pontibacterium granulatum]MDI3325081.1 hypothetical protein [Pontibacterium granulatum]
MFPNLHTLTDTPVARTNLIQLEEAPLATIRRLLAPISNLYAIDFGLQRFNKERKEKRQDFHSRVHSEVKASLRQTLGLNAQDDVKYELHRLPSGHHVYFYLAPAAARHTSAHLSLSTRIEQLCQKLAANEQSLTRLIQGLFSLHLKMILLEQATDRFSVSPVYFNAVMYLNARLSQPIAKKSGTGVMEAFELDVFASEQRELAFTLHKRKFLVEPAEELHLSLDYDKVWFNTDSGRVKARRKLDARDSKLEFFRERSGYGECQAYTYNVVMNAVVERLTELEIPHTPIPFQATHEVNQFVTGLDQQLANTLLVVNNGVDFSATQEAYFFDALAAQLPGYQLWPMASLERAQKTSFSDLPANTSILVLNPVEDEASNSIRQLDDGAAEYGNFFAVYDIDRKLPGLRWDTYTQLKLDRLHGWLKQKPLPVALQGMNVDSKLLDAINYIEELSNANPEQYTADLAKPRSRLKSAFNLVNSKIRRTKTELWFKESVLTQRHIPLPNLTKGRYTAFAVRSTDNGSTLLGHIELSTDSNLLSVVNAGVTEGDLDWLAVEHPALERLDKLFNNSFYLYDHSADVLLTTYNSVRVPRLIGPSHLDVVDLYSYQEQEKGQAERDGVKFSDYTITRSAKADQNVLPYLMSPGRSIHDPLTKSQKMKHHHTYLQPHDDGLYVLVSDSQPANPSMARPNLVENLLIWDAQGDTLDVFHHPLTGVYLNSFTLDMLKSGDSSKSSIFAKLARLMVEN